MESRNYKWADAEHTMLDCEIEHKDFGWIPYTTSENDTGLGKEIWDNRDNLDIAEYEGLSDEMVYDIIRDNVQLMLDRKAQEKNYDNGFALSTYSNSTIPTFKEEAKKYIEWRDKCWMVCYGLLDKYQRGEIERPTVDDVMNQMPTLEW